MADVVEAIIGTSCFYKNPIDSIRLVSFLLGISEYAEGLIRCYKQGYVSVDLHNYLRQNAAAIPINELEREVEKLEAIQGLFSGALIIIDTAIKTRRSP